MPEFPIVTIAPEELSILKKKPFHLVFPELRKLATARGLKYYGTGKEMVGGRETSFLLGFRTWMEMGSLCLQNMKLDTGDWRYIRRAVS